MRNSLLVFGLANIFAGVLNYGFQVVAGRLLQPEEFASFSSWLAFVAVFGVFGSFIQYYSNFKPVNLLVLRAVALIGVMIFLSTNFLVLMQDELDAKTLGTLTVFIGLFLGWLIGQMQIREKFFIISFTNIFAAAVKVSGVLALIHILDQSLPFHYSIFCSTGMAILALFAFSLRLKDECVPDKKSEFSGWSAACALSVLTVATPQIDLLLLGSILPKSDFESYARSSLFARGLFFLFLILAQWLLPKQIKNSVHPNSTRLVVCATTLMALTLTLISPTISRWLLNWPESPPRITTFLACFNMSLLTLIFLKVQHLLSVGLFNRIWATIILLVTLSAGLLTAGKLTSLSSSSYFMIFIGGNLLIILLISTIETKPKG